MLIATSPTVHSEIIQLQREESPAKSDESRKMFFILQLLEALTLPLLTDCF